MEYIAIAKNIKISPRKIRLIVDGVKKNEIKRALANLSVMNKRAGLPLKKTIDSAIANAVNNFKADKEGLAIKDIIVTEGMRMKRYHYAARGRVRPYKKRTSHIRVILTDNAKSQAQNPKSEPIIENKSVQNEQKEGKESSVK